MVQFLEEHKVLVATHLTESTIISDIRAKCLFLGSSNSQWGREGVNWTQRTISTPVTVNKIHSPGLQLLCEKAGSCGKKRCVVWKEQRDHSYPASVFIAAVPPPVVSALLRIIERAGCWPCYYCIDNPSIYLICNIKRNFITMCHCQRPFHLTMRICKLSTNHQVHDTLTKDQTAPSKHPQTA